MKEKIFEASITLMAALIESGNLKPFSDVDRESYNKYCIEKAKAIWEEINKSE